MGGQDGVVGLHHGRGHLWGGVDGELQLGLLAIVNGQTLHEQGGETRAGATTEAVEEQEALETGALIGQLADTIKDQIDKLLADGVVTTGVVVGGIFLAGDQLFGVEELTVGTGTHLICKLRKTLQCILTYCFHVYRPTGILILVETELNNRNLKISLSITVFYSYHNNRIANVMVFRCIYQFCLNILRLFQRIHMALMMNHDDVIISKHFPRYWPYVWVIHRSPLNSPPKGQ